MQRSQSGERIRVGTRGSKLAIRQAGLIVDALRAAQPGIEVSVEVISTPADSAQDRPISQFGDKGVFVRTIERALLEGVVDLGVHSLKDIPGAAEDPGLVLSAFSQREDPRDVLVSRTGETLRDLPGGAIVGTSSPRRRVQLRALRPDLNLREIRGNVDTRLAKVRGGEYDAIVLAAAGLIRLGLQDAVSEYLPANEFVPDAGQGIVAVQTREGSFAEYVTGSIDDVEARAAATAERSVARALDADCHSPVGALARIEGDLLILHALAATADGTRIARTTVRGHVDDAASVGWSAGEDLLAELQAPEPNVY